MDPLALLHGIGTEKFDSMIRELPRAAQRAAMKQAGIQRIPVIKVLNPIERRSQEIAKIRQSILKGGQEAADAVLYGWLTSRRWTILGDFLDHFHIPHNKGLTEHDLDFLKGLSREKLREVAAKLVAKHDRVDVAIYLTYLGHKNNVDLVGGVDEIEGAIPAPEAQHAPEAGPQPEPQSEPQP